MTRLSRSFRRLLRAFPLVIATFATISFGALAPASAATDAFPAPVVVVYPFTVSGSTVATQAGGNVALLLANRLQSLGGVDVRPFTPGTERHDYLTAALKQSADYYVTGFLTPIGSEVSLITQVVSTYGGTVVWSNTTTIRTYNDALAQADGLHEAIVRHAQRGLASLGAPPPPSSPEPQSKDAAGVSLNRILGRHKHAGSPTAAPSPSSSPSASASAASAASPIRLAASPAKATAAPSPAPASSTDAKYSTNYSGPGQTLPGSSREEGTLVANVGGGADATLRSYAATAIAAALRKGGVARVGGVPVAFADAVAHVPDLCKANAATSTVYAAALESDPEGGVALDVTAYDCAGKKLGTEHAVANVGRRETTENAVSRAATQAVDALLRSTPHRS